MSRTPRKLREFVRFWRRSSKNERRCRKVSVSFSPRSNFRKALAMSDETLRELAAELNGELTLGHDRDTDHRVYLPLEDIKETSVHVIGGAGFGKSYYLR